MSPTLKAGPAVKDGALVRTVAEGGRVFAEEWSGSAWVRAGNLADAVTGAPASEATLAAFGVAPDGESALPAPPGTFRGARVG